MPHNCWQLARHNSVPFSQRRWQMVNYGVGILKSLVENYLIDEQRIEPEAKGII